MDLDTTTHGQTLLITVRNARIDSASALAFKDGMRAATQQGPERVLLDLGGVDFIDSSGLGAVVACMKQLDPGQRLDLVALTPTVAKVFQLTRMNTLFAIHPDLETALTANAA
ncbi:STAS domain-containing protein [Litorisediminicola beolgyonensis]|uniref:Anti-sigma factor antagonist n=1 Tax=Litorisediminicola beolgyonensis TaxID=1173614 RepID=A0ABW3ZDB3_9RHOB